MSVNTVAAEAKEQIRHSPQSAPVRGSGRWLCPDLALACLWLALNVLDLVTTQLGLGVGAVEANPVTSWLIGSSGEVITYCLRLTMAAAAALCCYRLGHLVALKWASVLLGAVVISNIAVIVLGG